MATITITILLFFYFLLLLWDMYSHDSVGMGWYGTIPYHTIPYHNIPTYQPRLYICCMVWYGMVGMVPTYHTMLADLTQTF